jgi:hypothetical protein
MKAIHLLVPLSLGVALTALAADITIPPPPPGYAAGGAPPPPAYRAAPDSPYFIEIKGGFFTSKGSKERKEPLLRNLVNVLREHFPDANFVVSPEVMEVVVEELKLRDASLRDTLEALSVASGGRFVWEKRLPRPTGYGVPGAGGMPRVDPTTGLPLPPTEPAVEVDEYGLFVLRSPDAPPDIRRTVMAFNLAGYLQAKGKSDPKGADEAIDQVRQIIAQTLDALTAGRPTPRPSAEFKFHPGASLLVVIGPPEAIEVAHQVVNALPGQMPQGTTVSSEGYTWQLGNVIMGGSNVPPGQITIRPANKAAK